MKKKYRIPRKLKKKRKREAESYFPSWFQNQKLHTPSWFDKNESITIGSMAGLKEAFEQLMNVKPVPRTGPRYIIVSSKAKRALLDSIRDDTECAYKIPYQNGITVLTWEEAKEQGIL